MSSDTEPTSSDAKPRASLRERQLQLRADAILDAAHQLLAEQGYGDMNMDDIAAHVGISKATLYQHFPSKEELAVQVILRGIDQYETFIRALDPDLPAIQRLELTLLHILEQRFQKHRADLGRARPSFQPTIRIHPDYRTRVANLEAVIANLVEEAKAAGDIVPTLSTRIMVKILLSGVRDGDYLELLADEEVTLDELKETMVSIFFRGLGAPRRDSF